MDQIQNINVYFLQDIFQNFAVQILDSLINISPCYTQTLCICETVMSSVEEGYISKH